jgi:beta-glucanase (GH16 family)
MMRSIFLLVVTLIFFSCGEDDTGTATTTADVTPNVSIDGFTALEADQDKSVFISIRLDRIADEEVMVFVESQDITAEAGLDYEAIAETITFSPGSVQENIRLNVFGDEDSELDETFRLNIISATGANIGSSSTIITIENDDAGNGEVVIPNSGYSTPKSYPMMSLLWSDEFDGEFLNEDFWSYETGNGSSGWGNNELQFYRKENTSIVDVNLVIQAREENFGGFQYTSSRLITKDKFEFTHGRVDIRAVLPEGQGVWPALWMLGENINTVSWPRCGEIDIMELVGHEPSTVHGTVHYANAGGNHIFTGEEYNLSGGTKFSDEYHVFSINWEEDLIQFYVNDNLYYTVTPNSNPYPFNDPFFFIFNVAIGGNWPGSPDATTLLPQNMIVDYIRVFQ